MGGLTRERGELKMNTKSEGFQTFGLDDDGINLPVVMHPIGANGGKQIDVAPHAELPHRNSLVRIGVSEIFSPVLGQYIDPDLA